jgi:OOP family OmpA-OmpF porin
MLKKIAVAALLSALMAPVFAADEPAVYAGADVGSSKIDSFSGRKTSFGGFLGYQFNSNWALEGAYRRLASISVSGVDVDMNQTALSVVGFAPINSDFQVFGRLGYNKLTASASAVGVKAKASDNGAVIGVGVAYSIAPNISARLEFQRPSSDATNMSVGLSFKF